MIEMSTWKELVRRWESEVGPAYQIPRRSKDRLQHFSDTCTSHLKDKRVVEIGSNAGIFGYEISRVAESYLGVEPANKVREAKKEKPRTDYFKQAMITKSHMIENGLTNADFTHSTIPEFCAKYDPAPFNAFVACFALYHFLNHEIDLLIEKIWPGCDTIIIQNRCQDRPKKHNRYNFYKTKNVVKFFESLGYTCEVIPGMSGDKRQKFDEIIAKKEVVCQEKMEQAQEPEARVQEMDAAVEKAEPEVRESDPKREEIKANAEDQSACEDDCACEDQAS